MSNVLDADRLNRLIGQSREKVKALDPDKAKEIDSTLDLTFDEHFSFQNMQAEAHVLGRLTPDAAQIVYQALGETLSDSNGGWSAGVDTAKKFIITKLMSELMGLKLAGKVAV